jgi:hypothetical protein
VTEEEAAMMRLRITARWIAQNQPEPESKARND